MCRGAQGRRDPAPTRAKAPPWNATSCIVSTSLFPVLFGPIPYRSEDSGHRHVLVLFDLKFFLNFLLKKKETTGSLDRTIRSIGT